MPGNELMCKLSAAQDLPKTFERACRRCRVLQVLRWRQTWIASDRGYDMTGTGGYVTTHVLDTARGRPAAGIQIDAYRLGDVEDDVGRVLVGSATTNADGRTDVPIIGGDAMAVAEYELIFNAAAYLGQLADRGGVPFLATIPIRFGVSDASQHYHVPLLLSPFGYATYRGS